MVARVTCSLCLALNFWPSEQNLPTLTTPASLHLPPCSLSTLYSAPPFILHSPVLPRIVSAWQVCVLHAATLYFSCLCTCVPYFYFSLSHKSSSLTRHWVKLSSTEFLSFFSSSCLRVYRLSHQTKGRLGLRHQISIHPQSIGELHLPPARQTWLSSLPPTSIGLLSSHLCKYEREREMERGRVEKSEMERYPRLWLLGGAQQRIPHSWANLHSHRTSPVHSPLFSLLIHSLFL